MAGDESNDVYIHVQHSGMPALISEGCFIDWNTLPNIDFSKPYWYSNCIRDINYGTKVFAMTGMYNLEILRSRTFSPSTSGSSTIFSSPIPIRMCLTEHGRSTSSLMT